jgi:hypothetical protein
VLVSLRRAPAQVLQATGQVVARLLELLEAENARACRGAARIGAGAARDSGALAGLRGGARRTRERRDVGESPGNDLRQLALEPSNLCAQRAARGALPDPIVQ